MKTTTLLRNFGLSTTIAVAFLLMPATAVSAGTETLIVDTAFVKSAADRGAVLWDVRDEVTYAKGHIPGAVNVGHAGKALRNPNTEDYLPTAQIEHILASVGIDPAKEVVVYGGRGTPYAYFGLVTLQHFGGDRAYVYHDGFDAWQAAGEPVITEPPKVSPVSLRLRVNPNVTVSTQDVLAALERPEVQILDVRTPMEYKGVDIRAIRGGHVPGAVHVPYEQNYVDPAGFSKLRANEIAPTDPGLGLQSAERLKPLYAGLDPEKETIVYCQSSVRASQSATVLKSLGFKNVKVYESSWLGYGNTLEAPAEDVAFVNVGLLKKQIASLQKQVQMLSNQVAAMTKGEQ